MRLVELEPSFLRWSGPDSNGWNHSVARSEANGLWFVCPKCMLANAMHRPGVHGVICWDPSVPQTVPPNPGRWNLVGASFEDLTLVAGSSSVLLMGGCNAHFFIRNGEIVMA